MQKTVVRPLYGLKGMSNVISARGGEFTSYKYWTKDLKERTFYLGNYEGGPDERHQYLAHVLIHEGINEDFIIHNHKGGLQTTQNVLDMLHKLFPGRESVGVMQDEWYIDQDIVFEIVKGS